MPMLTLGSSVGAGSAENNPQDVTLIQERLQELGFDWVTPDGDVGVGTMQAIILFQAIVRGRQSFHNAPPDGVVDLNGLTHQWLMAENAPRWQRLPHGVPADGFVNFEAQQTGDKHDFCTSWLAEALRNAATQYRDLFLSIHPNSAVLQLNDASLPRGGDTTAHAGHETGLSCDLRLPQLDGGSGGITWQSSEYDQVAARAMIEALRAQPHFRQLFFNDPDLIAEGLCARAIGHDNHFHFEINPPELIF